MTDALMGQAALERAHEWLRDKYGFFCAEDAEEIAGLMVAHSDAACAAAGAAVWAAVDQALEAETWCPRDVTRGPLENLRARLAARRPPPPGGGAGEERR